MARDPILVYVNIMSFSIKAQQPNIIHKAWFCVFKGLL